MKAIMMANFKEAFRKKLFLLGGLATLAYLGLFTLLMSMVAKDINRMGSDASGMILNTALPILSVAGFYFSSMLVALLTILLSVGAISLDVESGVLHAILTRPIRRVEFVMGKYFGLAVFLTMYSTFLYFALLFIPWAVGFPIQNTLTFSAVLCGYLLFILEPLTLLALSLFGSVSMKTLGNGMLMAALYILGLIGGMMEQFGGFLGNRDLVTIGILSSLVSPFDVIYRKMTSVLFSGTGMGNPMFGSGMAGNAEPSAWMMAYVGLYLLAMLFWAVRKFGKKDIA
jgi:ABC-type transport system involved in multi-copper enzyme maturation permease subunit